MNIAISKIKPNPNNPRHIMRTDLIDKLSASIKEIGLLSPIKVRELTPEEMASLDKPSPVSSPLEKSEGGGYEYQLISGHRRLLACQKLGWTEIPAEVLKVTKEQEMFLLGLENMGLSMFWLEKYEYIENLMKECPNLKQQEVADRLQTTQRYISCALKVIGVLNAGAREKIYTNCIKSGGWEVSEAAVFALTDLATGQPDDQNRVEQALKEVLDREMTEKEVKAMVEQMKSGGSEGQKAEGLRVGSSEEWQRLENGETEGQKAGGLVQAKTNVKGEVALRQAQGKEKTGADPDSTGLPFLPKPEDPDAGFWKEMDETRYFQIKRPAKGGIHIIIPDMNRAKAAVLGATGAVWALERALRAGEKGEGAGGKGEQQQNPTAGKLEENPYWADLPGLVKDVQGSRLNGKGMGRKTSLWFLVSSFEVIHNQKLQISLHKKQEIRNKKLQKYRKLQTRN